MSSRKRPRLSSSAWRGAGWSDESASGLRSRAHTCSPSGQPYPEAYNCPPSRNAPGRRPVSPDMAASSSRRHYWTTDRHIATHHGTGYRRDECRVPRHSHSSGEPHWSAYRHGDSRRPSMEPGQSHSKTSQHELKPKHSDSRTPINKRKQEQSDSGTAATKQPRLTRQNSNKNPPPRTQRTRTGSPSPTHFDLGLPPESEGAASSLRRSVLHTIPLQEEYYQREPERQGLSATDALRQLHQSFTDTLLTWRDIPLEFSLLAQSDCSTDSEKISPAGSVPRNSITPSETVISSDDMELGTAGNGEERSQEDATSSNSAGVSVTDSSWTEVSQEGDETSSPEEGSCPVELCLQRKTAPLLEKAEGGTGGSSRLKGVAAHESYLADGGGSECGSDAERNRPSFNVKPALHSCLCCNIPTKFSKGVRSRRRQPGSHQHRFSASETNARVHVCSHPAHYHNYHLTISPEVNFKSNWPTVITGVDGKTYKFSGFYVVSSITMDNIPPCAFQYYGGEYTLHLQPEPLPQNFTIKDILLFEEYLFVGLLELFDWAETLKPFSDMLMFLPRFMVPARDCGSEVLAMSEVLRYLIQSYKPLIQVSLRKGDRQKEMELSRKTYGLLVSHPALSPAAIRVDRLEWPKDRDKRNPLIVHCSSRINDRSQPEEEQKDKQAHSELQEKAAKSKLKRREHFEQTELKHKLSSSQAKSDHREMFIDFPSDGFYSTGIYTDIVQHTLLLPIIAHHILFHDSLHTLEERLQYHFKDRQLLQRAVTHPSHYPLFGTSKAHLRTVMSNCGLKRPERAGGTAGEAGGRGRGLDTLVEDIGKGEVEIGRQEEGIRHNEQLEFLGDATLEYLCSLHLYHIFPHLTDGQLTMYRRVLVKNKHLSTLASQLQLGEYMLVAEDIPFSEATFTLATANCLEALLGAVYLDGGLPAVDKLFARLVFHEEDLYRVWMNYPPDPLQQENTTGDRHMIPQSEFLQRLVPLEESVGVEFRHIRLLARAFTHPSVGYTNLTRGSYQRLEFLGDAVLQFLASDYAYRRLPTHHEGHLSLVRMLLVHNKELAKLSQELTFDKYILSCKSEGIQMTGKILADVVESFLAALLLDKGLAFAKRFLDVSLFPKLAEIVKSSELLDPNTRMHQAAVYTCKREGTAIELPEYRTLRTEGPSNSRLFTVGVYFRGSRVGVGKGPNLREARKSATENALASGALMLPPSQKQILK